MAIIRPKLKFIKGQTYTIDVSDASNSGHQLRFTADSGTTEYTTGVTATGTPGTTGATVTFAVPENAPNDLNYYCATHGLGMGNKMKTFNPGQAWYGNRGMAIGGQQPSNSNIMQYFDITSTGNAQDFGDLTETVANASAGGNGLRGVRINGSNTSTMDYWTFATLGNAQDFGDTLLNRSLGATVADGIYAITGGAVASGYQDNIEYITVATTGNALDFGDLLGADGNNGGTNDTTRGIFAGGTNTQNVIQYITMATPGNAIDFGDLLMNTQNMLTGIVSDNTYGVFQGGVAGSSYQDVIQYITIQSTGNATDFGDLAQARAYGGQTSDAASKRGVVMGGYYNPGGLAFNSIEYITIDTPGNALDFGDLTGNNERNAGVSGAAA